MRANVPHIFAIGDIVCQPMLVHQAQVVAEVIADELPRNKALAENRKFSAFNARVISSVAYTDTQVVWVRLTEDSGLAPRALR